MHRTVLMPAIDQLMKRLGFVKIARYGLVLTPEGRIMSLRPVVLDDGLGGRIVGWPDGDLAAMELQKWEPARPASKPAVATRLAVPPPPIPLKPMVISQPVQIAPIPVLAPVAAAPVVAPAPQVEEDEWEWEIALARARAAAEEVEQAAAALRPRTRSNTVPPPMTLPVVMIPPVAPASVTTVEYDDKTVETVTITNRPRVPAERPLATPIGVRKQPTPVEVRRQPATLPMAVVSIPPVDAPKQDIVAVPLAASVVALPLPQKRPGTSPPTVIPVPKLPSIKERMAQIQPVVANRPSRTRFAKGTGPLAQTQVGVPPPPRPVNDTFDDKTAPGLAAVSLPSVKRYVR